MRRFLVAGLDGDRALVAVERGGLGYGVEVTFFSHTDGTPKIERAWMLTEAPRTLRALMDRLAAPEPR